MRRLTVSKLELADHCLHPFRKGTPHDVNAVNPSQALGNAFHDWAAGVINCAPLTVAAIAEKWKLDEEAAVLLQQFVAHWTSERKPLLGWQAEVAYAFDVVTGKARKLGKNLDRKYDENGAGPHDVCGTADLVYWDWAHETIVVEDWKTGRQEGLRMTENRQLRALGAMAARAHGASKARVIVTKLNDEGIWSGVEELDAQAIATTLASISLKAEEIDLTAAVPVPGVWCGDHYCPAAGQCPALLKIAAEYLALSEEGKRHLPIVAGPAGLETVEGVSRTISRLVALEAQSGAIWKAVKARVEALGEDIPIEGGGYYGRTLTTRESIVADQEAVRVLSEHGIDAAVKRTITKASVVEAIKATAPKGQAAVVEREVMHALRSAGATRSVVKPGLGFKEGA